MSDQPLAVPSIHQDHRNWQSEHSMWRLDMESWNKQIAIGISELEELQQMLAHQQIVLKEHELKIKEQEQAMFSHEHELANCEKQGLDCGDGFTEKHFDISKRIDGTRSDHERIKTYHHNLMAKLNGLAKTMDATM